MAKKEMSGRKFSVVYTITLDVGVTMAADSLEAAIESGRKLNVLDVVDLRGNDHNDSEIRVSGAWECR